MLSRSEIKKIRQLTQKKFRDEQKLFIAEGPKVVRELLNCGFIPKVIYSTETFPGISTYKIAAKELEKISLLTTPNKVLGVFEMKKRQTKINPSELSLALEDIRDPGNLGTIIRIADWFCIKNIYCSETCVDVYNPKVIQATMGSIARVNVSYVKLSSFLGSAQLQERDFKIFGAVMNGKNIYSEKLPSQGILLIGNESKGISEELLKIVTDKITIPSFGKAESLNAAVATAIICSEFKRRTILL